MAIPESLQKISNAVGIPLEYVGGKVLASKKGALVTPIPGLTLPLAVAPKLLFYNEVCGLVIHVVGDLYILVSHYHRTDAVCLFIINSSTLGGGALMVGKLNSKMSLKTVIGVLRPGIVKAFVTKGGDWKPLEVPV